MHTSDYERQLAAALGCSDRHAQEIREASVAIVANALDRRENVTIAGLGTLKLKFFAGRTLPVPSTGKLSTPHPRYRVRFSPCASVAASLAAKPGEVPQCA